jgi:hypothetical protein
MKFNILSCICNKVISVREKILFENKEHANHTIAHLCGVMECKIFVAEPGYRLQK